MSDFTPIQTQEEFDKAIKGRLAQKDREAEERYKDYLAPDKVSELKADYEKKLEEAKKSAKEAADKASGFDKTVAELTARAEKAENSLLKNKIAFQHKLPLGFAERLMGTTEEELTKDAETLAELAKEAAGRLGTAPLHSNDTRSGVTVNNENAGIMQLLGQLDANQQKG